MKHVNEARNLVSEKLASAPASPLTGRRYFDTTRGVERYYNGTAWVDLDEPVTVSTSTPPLATTETGDLWWDTDETASGITTPLGVTDGGTGATSPASARASLAVPSIGNSTTVAGAPTTGTWARGDQYLDSANVVWTCVTSGSPGVWKAPPGTELAYNQITTSAFTTATTAATATVGIEGTTRTYDGQPIIIEFFTPLLYQPNLAGGWMIVNLWDGATDLGEMAQTGGATGSAVASPALGRRKMTPTVGSHNFRAMAWVYNAGQGQIGAGAAAAGAYGPAYIRVTVA